MKSTGRRPQTAVSGGEGDALLLPRELPDRQALLAEALQDPSSLESGTTTAALVPQAQERVGQPPLPGLRGREPVRVGVGARQRAALRSARVRPAGEYASRRTWRRTLPTELLGISSTNTMRRGRLKLESVPAVAQ